MAFAFKFLGMLSFASWAALAAGGSAAGCIVTNPVEFSAEQNYPPSAISQPGADYPLREIGQLNLDDPVETEELPLEVIIRDPNVDQTLEYRIFLDSTNPPGSETPIDFGPIEPQGGQVDRLWTFNIPYTALAPGECHKIELVIVGEFRSFVEPRRPVEEGDVDDRVWWIEVVDGDNPTIEVECQ